MSDRYEEFVETFGSQLNFEPQEMYQDKIRNLFYSDSNWDEVEQFSFNLTEIAEYLRDNLMDRKE